MCSNGIEDSTDMEDHEYKKLAIIDQNYWWFKAKKMYIETFLKLLRDPSNKQKILDVGCGTGGITLFLQKFGTVQAIERNQFACTVAKKRGLAVIQADANRLPFAPHSFSLITCFDVLYHKKVKIDEIVAQFSRVLKPKGNIIITDSALPQLWSHHDTVMHARQRFTLEEMSTILEKHGFVVLRKTYIFFSLFPFVFFTRKVLHHSTGHASVIPTISPLLEIIFLFLCKLEAYSIRFISLPLGSSLLVLAQKKNNM